MKIDLKRIALVTSGIGLSCLFAAHSALAQTTIPSSFIGWQTYSNCGATNNTGVCDATPESNSTFDASAAGRRGRGQQTNNGFLNGDGFGNDAADATREIVNIPLADGSPGVRIGPFGSAIQGAPDGTSSWKFSTSTNERTGDISITNESSFYFRLQFIHFDGRVGNGNSPQNLEIKYLSGDGTLYDNALVRLDNGNELVDLNNIYNTDFGPGPVTVNVSHSIGGTIGTQAYLAPGASAGFRFVWTDFLTNGAESQLDNVAFEGQFFLTDQLQTQIDVPEPAAGGVLPCALVLLSAMARRRSPTFTPKARIL